MDEPGEKQFQDGGGADNNGESGVGAGPCLRAAAAGPRRAGGERSGLRPGPGEGRAAAAGQGWGRGGGSGAAPASGEKEEVGRGGAERAPGRAGGRNRGGGEPGGERR